MTPVQVEAYLNRMGYRGARGASAAVLKDLHTAHLLAVPFENLSIHAGEPIVLDTGALFDKIVRRRRGGFCYELNGLFAVLLQTLGFSVAMLSARVARADGGFGPDFDHMALLVTLPDGPWLADVGFGDSFFEPLRLQPGHDQVQVDRSYRLEPDGDHLVLISRSSSSDDRKTLYRFDMTPHPLEAFTGMCRFHQTSPESHFTRNPICSLATRVGRVTLRGMRLITTVYGRRQERDLQGADEYTAVLQERFGIRVPGVVYDGVVTRKQVDR